MYTQHSYADGFKHHIHQDHNMWLYIFFMHHLRLKRPSQFTGQELLVHSQIHAMDFSFFPLSQALAVERKETNEARMYLHLAFYTFTETAQFLFL